MQQAGREIASGTTGITGRQGKGKPLQEDEVVSGVNEERSRIKSQLGLWERERERKREVDLTGSIKAPSFPIQLLAAYTVQN